MANSECIRCGIAPADLPDEVMEQFEDDYEDGVCPGCQTHLAGTWTAEWTDMGDGAPMDPQEDY